MDRMASGIFSPPRSIFISYICPVIQYIQLSKYIYTVYQNIFSIASVSVCLSASVCISALCCSLGSSALEVHGELHMLCLDQVMKTKEGQLRLDQSAVQQTLPKKCFEGFVFSRNVFL